MCEWSSISWNSLQAKLSGHGFPPKSYVSAAQELFVCLSLFERITDSVQRMNVPQAASAFMGPPADMNRFQQGQWSENSIRYGAIENRR